MRILMISDVYFPRVNGVSTSIQTYRTELMNQGHQIDLVAPGYEQLTEDEQGIYRVSSSKVPLDPEDRFMNKKLLRQQTKELLEKNNYDLIHIQTPFLAHYIGVDLAREYSIPVIETYHTYFEEYMYNYIPFLPKGLLKMLVRQFTVKQCNALDALIVPSTAMLEVLQDYGVKTKAEIIPTGIQQKLFANGDGALFRKKHNIAADTPLLVHVGRVCYEKNIDFLVRMHKKLLHEIPDAVLLIAGEGTATKRLKKLCVKLGIEKNVKFVGYLDRHTELQGCYAAGDVFVFSSRTETQGLVLLEAMASGVPVVSTAVMGTKDILEPKRGAFVSKENIIEFSDKVSFLLKNKFLQKQLSIEARRYSAEWSIQSLTAKMITFYEQVLKREYLSGLDEDSVEKKETAKVTV